MKENRHQRKAISFVMDNKALVILILLSISISLGTNRFLTQNNIINVVRQICVSGILGMGYTLVVTQGSLDLSVGSMLGLIGVVVAKISLINGMPFWAAILLGILLGAALGYTNGFIMTKFDLPPFIVTLATQSVFKGTCYLISANTAVSGLPNQFKTIGQGYVGIIPIPVIILVILAIISGIILYTTRLGRYLTATGGNMEAARLSGINVNRIRRIAYSLVGVCVAIAAVVMNGRVFSAQPTAGQGMEMDAIAAVVLGGTSLAGGKGNIIGTIFGCLIVGVINNGLNLINLDSNWQLIAKGLTILMAVFFDVQSAKILKSIHNRKGLNV